MLRLAHLSDLHFGVPSYHINQFFSKEWLGNTNLLFVRKRQFQTDHLQTLPSFLEKEEIQYALLTGDFATTARSLEFEKAVGFTKELQERGIQSFTLPGNHDVYTRSSEKEKRFYQFFPSKELENTRVETRDLGEDWIYIGLDCALATGLIFSHGKFFEECEQALREVLEKQDPKKSILLANHFPLFTTGRPRHDLWRAKALQELLREFPRVKLYLHGHDHSPLLVDRQKEGYPLVINSGSCAQSPKGTFSVLELEKERCTQKLFLWKPDGWKLQSKTELLFQNP